VVHVRGNLDPVQDIDIISLELILSDLTTCENNIAKVEKQVKTRKDAICLLEELKKVRSHLNQNLPVRTLQDIDREVLKSYRFLTDKSVLYVCNISENDLNAPSNKFVQQVEEKAAKEGARVLTLCAKLESEIAQLELEERSTFLESVGLKESGLTRLIHASFDMLGLITFVTAGEMETKAWTIRRGATALEAAGKIHTDIQRGFIRAEVISYTDFIACGGRNGAKEAGKVRSEGKEYVVQDGDVVLFLHSH